MVSNHDTDDGESNRLTASDVQYINSNIAQVKDILTNEELDCEILESTQGLNWHVTGVDQEGEVIRVERSVHPDGEPVYEVSYGTLHTWGIDATDYEELEEFWVVLCRVTSFAADLQEGDKA